MKKIKWNKRIAKQITVIIAFLLVNFGIVSLLSTIYYEFNSGADRSKLLHIDLRKNDFYLPTINVSAGQTEGRIPNKEIIKSIKEDYVKAWYVQKYALQNNDSKAIEDFYTDSAQVKIKKIIDENAKEKINIHSTSLNHNVHVKFFSEDGQVAYIDDLGVNERTSYYQQNKLVHQESTHRNYKAVLLLEDGFWRVRHKTSYQPKKKTSKTQETSSLTHIVQPQQTVYRLTKIYNISKEELCNLNPDKPYLTENILMKGDTVVVKKIKGIPKKKEAPSIKTNFPENFKIKGINYYPQKNPWFEFWNKYDTLVIHKDFKLIKDLGLNSVRIFIPYNLFGKGKVQTSKLKELIKTLDIAEEYQLKVVITFFDFYSNYQLLDYTICDRHVEKIVKAIKHHKALLQYDVKNEPDLDIKIHGKHKVVNWLDFIIDRIKIYDPETPVTIGWYSAEAAVILSEKVDFVSFHFYKDPDEFGAIYTKLKESTNKPIVIQEYGKHSFNSIWNFYRFSEKKQAEYHKRMQKNFKKYNVEHFISWTLYDFPVIDTKIFGSAPYKIGPQKNYGFIDAKGKLKPSAKYISGYSE